MRFVAAMAALMAGASVWVRPAPASASGGPSLQVLSTSQWGPDRNGDEHLLGEIVNNGSVPATSPFAYLNFYDASGTLLGTGSAVTEFNLLDPGQSAPFEFMLKPPPGYDHFSIASLTANASSSSANTYFGVQVTSTSTNSDGRVHFTGTITNDNSVAAASVWITLTGYDSSGRIAAIAFWYPTTDETGDMSAGQQAQFDVALPEGAPPVASYRIAAESPTAPQPSGGDTTINRVAGSDAVGTGIAISQQSFADQSAQSVTLARADYFSDALAGGPLAASGHGPLLITPGASQSSSLDPRVATEIQRVLPSGDTVDILGGIYALSANIDTQLQQMGYRTVRVAGQTAADTAVAIAGQLGDPTTVFEATGTDFPDALSAVPAAIKEGGAILLTDGPSQDPATGAYLSQHPSDTRYAVGGSFAAAGADPSAIPVWGYDLYDTSAVIAARFFPAATVYGAATGTNYPDALTGGVLMADGGRSGPILLVAPTAPLPPAAQGYLAATTAITSGYLFGGTAAVSPAVQGALSQTRP